jgi:hypothetical protein
MEVIMDTGATFTMLPGQYDFAWTNKKPCVHSIEGCFKEGGRTDKYIIRTRYNTTRHLFTNNNNNNKG